METKLFEIRDEGTFIPVMAVRIDARTKSERFLIERAGYFGDNPDPFVILWNMEGGNNKATSDVYGWDGSRTMTNAHLYIQEKWFTLTTGDVIDVQFFLGETETKKISESKNG